MKQAKNDPGKLFWLVLAALLIAGCTQPVPAAGEQPTVARIIIKFADPSQLPPEAFEVSTPGGAPVILQRERAMSGDAYLYNGRMNQTQLEAIVGALNQRADVDYAEADRRLGY